MALKFAFKVALPPTDPNANLVFQDGFIDDVTKEIVIKDHNSVELFRIGGGGSWLTDAASDEAFTGTVTKIVY
jgi:hypothetical protein